ncbi:increased dna methylation 1 [Nicotiana attenuata]|uniref:Increased dna methylation 1 n=1 Tax=Nicotiana attenuata TaxID=49451 RepID=A0A1J6I5E5_NICAT|nr:increased dna methylation 1 [Nicotiana attenuata]
MVRRSRKQKKQESSSSSSWSPESSDSSTDLHYSPKLPKKKAKKDILAKPINGYLSEDDTNLASSSMRTRRKRKCQSKKQRYIIDEPSSSENDQSSDVLSEEKFKWGRRKRAKRGRTRNSRKGNDQRQRTTTILSWLIDCKVIQENAEVFVMEEGEPKTKQGEIRKEGILCSCCNYVFTVADFCTHAGANNNNNIPSVIPQVGSGESKVYANLNPTFKKAKGLFLVDPQLGTHAGGTSSKPYEKIFIAETCSSLLSCMIQAWDLPEERNYRRFNLIENEDASDSCDDACMICADGGVLLCCDKCSTTYHHDKCLGMKQEVPKGSWYCSFCVCKFCGVPANENDYLLKCSQCEKKYHWECHLTRVKISIDINNPPQGTFCDTSCNEVYDTLERSIVGVERETKGSYKWTLLKNTDDGSGINIEDDYQRTVCHSKLAVARRLMEDCFEQITDRHTRIDVIKSVVYNCGSNFNRVNFRGFYTIILEKNEEIISAASIRIHGPKLAEMPFIATNKKYRRKGMCRELMVTIESVLHYLKVEKLVIPSVSERTGTWITKYIFHIVESPLPEEMKLHNTLMFHDATRLQKDLVSSTLARTCRANSRGEHIETLSMNGKKMQVKDFIWSEEEWPALKHDDFGDVINDIPVISLNGIWDNQELYKNVCQDMVKASEKWGFFKLVDHGVPSEIVENYTSRLQELFDLPMEQKLKGGKTSSLPLGYYASNPEYEQNLPWAEILQLLQSPEMVVQFAKKAWTNGRLKSVIHRAVVNKEKKRLSMAYFLNPTSSATIECPPQLIDPVSNPRKYVPFTWAELRHRLLTTRRVRGKVVAINKFLISS